MKRKFEDEQLIQKLHEKLDWFTFEASEEEFDEEQVNAILNLLDQLEPLPEKTVQAAADAEGAYARFCEKYLRNDAKAESDTIAEDVTNTSKDVNQLETDIQNNHAENKASAEFSAELGAFEKVDGNSVCGLNEAMNTAAGKQAQPASDEAFLREIYSRQPESRYYRLIQSSWGKAAAALLCVFAALTLCGITSRAVVKKPFMEIIRDGVNSLKITVTGNEMDESTAETVDFGSTDKVYYDSWEEVKKENPDILVPGYLPEGVELEEIYKQEFVTTVRYTVTYSGDLENKLLSLHAEVFDGAYLKGRLDAEQKDNFVEQNENVIYYQYGNDYKAIWNEKKILYSVSWMNINELKKVVVNMK